MPQPDKLLYLLTRSGFLACNTIFIITFMNKFLSVHIICLNCLNQCHFQNVKCVSMYLFQAAFALIYFTSFSQV